jgi:sulfur-carrier protein
MAKGGPEGPTRADSVVLALPEALTRLFAGAPGEVAVAASSVNEIIDELDRRWPGMRGRLCDSTPRIRRHINVFAGGRRVGLDAEIAPGTTVTIMTGVIG